MQNPCFSSSKNEFTRSTVLSVDPVSRTKYPSTIFLQELKTRLIFAASFFTITIAITRLTIFEPLGILRQFCTTCRIYPTDFITLGYSIIQRHPSLQPIRPRTVQFRSCSSRENLSPVSVFS